MFFSNSWLRGRLEVKPEESELRRSYQVFLARYLEHKVLSLLSRNPIEHKKINTEWKKVEKSTNSFYKHSKFCFLI